MLLLYFLSTRLFVSGSGVQIRDHYGQTEVGMVIGNLQNSPEGPVNVPLGSMGKSIPGWQVCGLEPFRFPIW